MTDDVGFKSLEEFAEMVKPVERVVYHRGSGVIGRQGLESLRNWRMIERDALYRMSKAGLPVLDMGHSYDRAGPESAKYQEQRLLWDKSLRERPLGAYISPLRYMLFEPAFELVCLIEQGVKPHKMANLSEHVTSLEQEVKVDEGKMDNMRLNAAQLFMPGCLCCVGMDEIGYMVDRMYKGKAGVIVPKHHFERFKEYDTRAILLDHKDKLTFIDPDL